MPYPKPHIIPAQHRDMEGVKGKREGNSLCLLLPKLPVPPHTAEVSPCPIFSLISFLTPRLQFFCCLLPVLSPSSIRIHLPIARTPSPRASSAGPGAAAGAVRAGRAPGSASRAPPTPELRLTHDCCQREKISDLERCRCLKPGRRRTRERGKTAFPSSREKAAALQRDKHIIPPQNCEGAAGTSPLCGISRRTAVPD